MIITKNTYSNIFKGLFIGLAMLCFSCFKGYAYTYNASDSVFSNINAEQFINSYYKNFFSKTKLLSHNNAELLELFTKNNKPAYLDSTYLNAGIAVISKAILTKELTKAEHFAKLLSNIPCNNDYYIDKIRFWTARIHFERKEYANSLKILMALNEKINSGYEVEFIAKIQYFIAYNNYKLKKYTKALSFYKSALTFTKNHEIKRYNILYKIAYCYYKLNNIEGALAFIEPYNTELNHLLNCNNAELEKAKLLQLRSFFYRELALTRNDSINLLKKSIFDCETSIRLLNRFIRHQYFESDQLAFNKRYNYFYYKTIEAYLRLYQSSPHDSLLFNALNYAEYDKNLTLSKYFHKSENQNLIKKNAEYIALTDSLQNSIDKLEIAIYNLQSKYQANDTILLKYYILKDSLINQIQGYETIIENKNPEYAKKKDNLPKVDLDFLKELSFKKQIIEYVISDEKVYIFLITNGHIFCHTFKLDHTFNKELETFCTFTHSLSAESFYDEYFYEFANTGHALYKRLIDPLKKHLNNKPLLIIPDNELNLLPFEALIYSPNEKGNIDYSQLNYLVKQYNISYASSLKIIMHQQLEKAHYKTDRILSYVPSYENKTVNNHYNYLALRNSGLLNLPGAKLEVNNINKVALMDIRAGKKASELVFKREAVNYPIVHCAMHAIIDDDKPELSKLVFTNNANNTDDGFLYAYEIPQLHLKSEMLVLSACNTSNGELNKGEGLLSLSRAFTKAGCKSVLSTLWSIPDEKSVVIINEFYNGLLNNQTKSESLSNAKRIFIESEKGINAHPYYWAGFVLSGSDSPVNIHPSKKYVKLVWLLILISSIMGVFIYGIKKANY